MADTHATDLRPTGIEDHRPLEVVEDTPQGVTKPFAQMQSQPASHGKSPKAPNHWRMRHVVHQLGHPQAHPQLHVMKEPEVSLDAVRQLHCEPRLHLAADLDSHTTPKILGEQTATEIATLIGVREDQLHHAGRPFEILGICATRETLYRVI